MLKPLLYAVGGLGLAALTYFAFRTPVAPEFDDGSFPGLLRALAGSHVDLTGGFTDHDEYVRLVALHANVLVGQGYLLQSDADTIIDQAIDSGIGL